MLDRSCVDLIWTTHGMLVADISMNQSASKCSILFKSVDNSIVTFINLIINKFCNTKRLSIVNVQKKSLPIIHLIIIYLLITILLLAINTNLYSFFYQSLC